MEKSEKRSLIYQTSIDPTIEEFSLELFTYSPDFVNTGTPIRKVTTFEELLTILDELDEGEPTH